MADAPQRSCLSGRSLSPPLPYPFVRAANTDCCYAIGVTMRNGFHVRRVVWGMLMARYERRPGEEIRRAMLGVVSKSKAKRGPPWQVR